jgi:transcriptional regulator with XRE-family HTH domain
MQLGHKIKILREIKKFTQKEFAESIGLSQGAYSRMEVGSTEINFSRLEKISEKLGMKPEEIIAFDEGVVFNVMHNDNGTGLVINNTSVTNSEKELYLQQIEVLKSQNEYLKSIIEKLIQK